MADGASKYAETEEVLQDIVALFSAKDDMHAVKESGKAIAELQAAGEARHREMLDSVKELSRQVDRANQEHSRRQTTMLDPAQKQQLLTERSRVEDNIRKLESETEGLKQQISMTEAKSLELSARDQQIRQQESVEVPRARHTISLYANISSMRWDYNSANVKGWVTSASGAGMKAFEMEAHQHTDFAVTNYLWDLMDAC